MDSSPFKTSGQPFKSHELKSIIASQRARSINEYFTENRGMGDVLRLQEKTGSARTLT